MQIVDDRALRVRVRHPNKILTAIPKSKQISEHEVVVNWGLDEARVLRNLNLKDVPSPIVSERNYQWTGKYAPFDHQKATAAFLTLNQRAFCFNEQGTGKTASAIWASDYLLNLGVIRRVLVVCPLSIMDSAWRADLFTFAMHRKVDIAYGSQIKRQRVVESDAEYVVINYAGLEIIEKEIAEGKFDLIIVDEANHYKNPQTNRWKALNRLVTPTTWLWMMTGTPAAQSPLDAYGIAKLVNPKGVPRYFGAFRDSVMFKITPFKWAAKPNATQTVFSVLQPAIRFSKEQCLDLPPMMYSKREVEFSGQQKKYYEILRKRMAMVAAGEEVTSANAAVNMNKLLQISCGAVYTDDKQVIEFNINKRYATLLEVIEETEQKVLVFVPYKHTIEILAGKLEADGITAGVIQGSVSANKRTALFDKFQTQPDPRVLIIQPQAAAHGVTLTAANTVVWWGPVPSVETYEQANARVHRSGQKHKCTVVQLHGSPVERKVYAALDGRITSHLKIVDLYKEILDNC